MEIPIEECKNMKGYLKKKSPKLMGGYQKRYFRILDGQIMVYSEKESDTTPKGQIQLIAITTPTKTEKKTFQFSLEGRDFTLQCESEEECDKWIFALTKCKELLEKSGVVSPVSGKQKSNKLETIDKTTLELLRIHGLTATDETELDNKLLTSKGIDKLVNINDPKIKCRMYHGFLFKKHKTQNYYQKRWFFLISHRPLTDDKYSTDESSFDKKLNGLEYDALYYYKYEDDDENSESQSNLLMYQSHKIEAVDKEDKYYLILDVEDRIFEFYSEIKGDRDNWFEILKNSRRTAKEYNQSVTKHPRNVEILASLFEKGGMAELTKKMNEEIVSTVGDYKETKELPVLQSTLSSLEDTIESTVDGCNSTTPPKTELLKNYAEYMGAEYLNIVKTFWENEYTNLDTSDVIKLGMKLFTFAERLEKVNLIDNNIVKNGKEFVKIFMKKTFKNILDVVENILKSEREIKAIKNESEQYCTNGPNDLFDILSKTFDLVKEHKNKYIYEELFNLFYEIIVQYFIGVDCVISNYKIEVDREFLIAIADNSVLVIQLLNQLIDDSSEMGVLTEKEINDAIFSKKIMSSINLMSQNSVTRFVTGFDEDISSMFKEKNFFDLNLTDILYKTNDIFGKYKACMNAMIVKKCWEEILKMSVFYYIKSLLTTAHKRIKNVEELSKKIDYDKGLLGETYETVVGKNLTEANLKILKDIIDFLEISSYMISSSCLTLREYIGPGFTLSTAKALIKLRVDFSSDEKKEAINQCKEVLDKYVDKKKGGNGFFDKMQQDMKVINEEEEVESSDDNELAETSKNTTYSLDDFLKEDDEDDELLNEEETTFTPQPNQEGKVEEVSDIAYEGVMEKKSHSNWQERFFQLKNGYLYWFKDKEASIIQNKLSIKNTLRVESHKNKKFLIVVADESSNPGSGKIYKFACKSEEEKTKWIEAITNEMKRLKGEQKIQETKMQMKVRKKVIVDFYKLPDVGKDRSYMKTKTRELMAKESYFLPMKPKPKKKRVSMVYGDQMDFDSKKNSVTNVDTAALQQFEVENVQTKKSEGIFDSCKKCFENLFKGNKKDDEAKEKLNPQQN